jgi:RNA polymerase sigma-70 factor (ECF subfamily)
VIAQEPQYRDWMIAALAGDATAYRQLLQELTRHLRGYFAKRLGAAAAEDVVQETLIAIHSRRATYDPSRPFTAWVYGIARYKLVDEFRRTKRGVTVPLDGAGELFGADEAEAATARRDVEKLLAKLPAAKRALVRAVKIEGHTIADMAAVTGMSESSVKVTLHRALRSLGAGVGGGNAD